MYKENKLHVYCKKNNYNNRQRISERAKTYKPISAFRLHRNVKDGALQRSPTHYATVDVPSTLAYRVVKKCWGVTGYGYSAKS